MKISIFGATGGTGQELVRQALEKGFEVSVLARSPEKLAIKHDHLKIVQGDVRNLESVQRTIEGSAAVLSCLGVWAGEKPIVTVGVANITKAMDKIGLKRIIVESAYGAGRPRAGFYGNGIRLVIKPFIKDKEAMEDFLKKTNFDYIIVRPSHLTNEIYSGKYRHGIDYAPTGFLPSISRADVADFMLSQVGDKNFVRQAVIISNK